jgi:hypothetical protein
VARTSKLGPTTPTTRASGDYPPTVTDSKRWLPAIAIVLAIIAIGMVSLAIYKRTRTRSATTAPADAAVDRRVPRTDAPEPYPEPEPDTDVDAALPDPPLDPGSCVPCNACKPTSCKCADGVLSTSMRCVNGCCVPPNQTCAETCKVHGGVAP